MPYAFVQDVPANEEIYGKVRALLPADAPGLQAHIVIKRDGGLRYVDVWDDEASFRAWTESEAFRKAHGQGRTTASTLLGPPRFIGWQVVRTVRRSRRAVDAGEVEPSGRR